MSSPSSALASQVETKIKNKVFLNSCCTKCKQAGEIVFKQIRASDSLRQHLETVLSDSSLKFAKGEKPHYDPAKHEITFPHNNNPDDMADGFVFETFNAAQKGDFTPMKDYKDEVLRWGTRRAEIEGLTMKGYAEAAQKLSTEVRTENMKKSVVKLETYTDRFVSTCLDEAHDPSATDMRCLPTKKLYIYQQLQNLGTDNVCKSFATLATVDIVNQLKYDVPTKKYVKAANCPADAKYSAMLALLNWTRTVWPSSLTSPVGKVEHRPKAFILIIERVGDTDVFAPLRAILTLAAFGMDDPQMKTVAENTGKGLNVSKFVYT